VKIETRAVHAGAEPDPSTGAIAPPIHLSTTFEHGPASQELHGYLYVREKNPTQDRLERAMALLEGGEDALIFASGMGAASALLQQLEPGAHAIFPDDVYVHVRVAHQEFLPKWGIEASAVDMTSPDNVKRAIRPNTKLVFMETPSNPLLKVTDIAAISSIAHDAGAIAAVDNTFATPIVQRPFEHGADVVMHSTTKYCGGHSDVQGGCLVLKRRDDLYARLLNVRTVLGSVSSPFNAWLVLRGLHTLACRMERHSSNGMAVAQALTASKKIETVFYPGLAAHPGHEVAARQMNGFGGMLSVLVKGSWDEAVDMASRLKLIRNATSLGGVESIIEHRASAEGKGSKVPVNLLRLSIGLEHPDDLIEDLLQALGG
jgi:cystathionine gamma-synthase